MSGDFWIVYIPQWKQINVSPNWESQKIVRTRSWTHYLVKRKIAIRIQDMM